MDYSNHILPHPTARCFFSDIHWNLTLTDSTVIENIENIEIESEVFWPVSISKLKSSIDLPNPNKKDYSSETRPKLDLCTIKRISMSIAVSCFPNLVPCENIPFFGITVLNIKIGTTGRFSTLHMEEKTAALYIVSTWKQWPFCIQYVYEEMYSKLVPEWVKYFEAWS